MLDLKPCPFCGKDVEMTKTDRYPRSGKYEGMRVDGYAVACNTFRCPCYHADITYFFTELEAIEAWNRRVPIGGDAQ